MTGVAPGIEPSHLWMSTLRKLSIWEGTHQACLKWMLSRSWIGFMRKMDRQAIKESYHGQQQSSLQNLQNLHPALKPTGRVSPRNRCSLE